jgi:hypothetical protein
MASKPQFGADFLDFAYGTPRQPSAGGFSNQFLDFAYGPQQEEERGFFVNALVSAGERGSEIASNFVQGLGTIAKAGENFLADTTGINPYIKFGEDGISFDLYAKPEETGNLLGTLGESIEQDFGATANRRFTWENFKGADGEVSIDDFFNFKELAGYILESGIHSAPDMGAAILAFPAYIFSLVQELGEERARNKGFTETSIRELAEAAPAAIATAALERLGARGILDTAGQGFGKGLLKGATKEAGTEFLQEQAQYAGEVVGTPVGFDLSTSLDRGIAGAVAGGGIGAAGGAVSGTLRSAPYDPFAGKEPGQVLQELQDRVAALNARVEEGLTPGYSLEEQRAAIEADARQASIAFPDFTFDLGAILDPISVAARAGQAEARAQGGDGLDQATNAAARASQAASQARTIETPTTQAVIETDSPQIADTFEQQVQETEARRQEQMAALTPGVDLIAALRASLNKAIITARREQRALGDSDQQQTQELEDDISRLQFGLTRLQEAQRYASEDNSAAIPAILNQVRDIAARPILSPEFGRRQSFDYVNVLEGELMPRMDETIELYRQTGVMPRTERPALRAPADFEVDPAGETRRPRSTTQQADIPDIRARDNLIEDQNIIYGDQPAPEPAPRPTMDFAVDREGNVAGTPNEVAARRGVPTTPMLEVDVEDRPSTQILRKASGEPYPTRQSASAALTRVKRENLDYNWDVIEDGAGFALQGRLPEGLPPREVDIQSIRETMRPGAGVIDEQGRGLSREEQALRAAQDAEAEIPARDNVVQIPVDYRPADAPRGEAEIEAEIAAIDKELRAINRGTTRGGYNADTDLFSAIKMMGGIKTSDARSEDFSVSGQGVPSGLFKANGKTFDELTELMQEAGYLVRSGDSYDAQVGDANRTIDIIRDAIFQWQENKDLTFLEAGQPGRKSQERDGLRNRRDALMEELRSAETFDDSPIPDISPPDTQAEIDTETEPQGSVSRSGPDISQIAGDVVESNRAERRARLDAAVARANELAPPDDPNKYDFNYRPMRAQDLKYLAGGSYTVDEAQRITEEGTRTPTPAYSRVIRTARTENPEAIGIIESLPDASIARYFDDAEPQFEVFTGYYGDDNKNFSQKVHERRALTALITRHRERTGQMQAQSNFMDEGRDTLTTYTEEELRERAETDTGAAEQRAQIDRERELFDLDPGEGSISGAADPTQTDRTQGSLFSVGAEERRARATDELRNVRDRMRERRERFMARSDRTAEGMRQFEASERRLAEAFESSPRRELRDIRDRMRAGRDQYMERSDRTADRMRDFQSSERELADTFGIDSPPRELVSEQQINATIDRIVGDNQAARNNIIVVRRFDDLPQNVQDDARNQGLNNVAAAVNQGKVYIVRNRMVDEAHVERAILHEATHVGAAKMYADEGVEKALNRMFVAMGGKKGFNKIVADLGLEDRIAPYRDGLEQSNYSGEVRNRILVEEVLANVGEQGSKTFKLRVQEAIGAIREWLRRNGFATLADLGVTDIVYAAKQARTAFSEALGAATDTDSRFSDMQEGRRAPRDEFNFYSGIEEILLTQGDKIFKASKRNPDALVRGDQILSFLKSQGMKPDEARFSRIEQFLEPETRYSRQQILDYMEMKGRPRYTEYQAVAEYDLDEDSLLNLGTVTNEKLFSVRVIVDEDLINNYVDEAMSGDEDYLIETAAQNLIQKFGSDSEDGQALDALLNVPTEIDGEPVSYMAQSEARGQLISELSPDLTEKLRAEVESLARMQEAQSPYQVYSISEDVKQAVKEAGQQTEDDMASLASIKISGNEDYGWTITASAMRGQYSDREFTEVLNVNESELSEAFMRARDFIYGDELMMEAREKGSAKFREYFDDDLDGETNWSEYREFTLEIENNAWGQYAGSHFDVNTVYDVITTDRSFDRPAAHEDSLRINTLMLDGPGTTNEYLEGKALFVEEAQSDWSSAVRKQGLDISRLDPDFDERVAGFQEDLESANLDRQIINNELEQIRIRIASFDDYKNGERTDFGLLGTTPRQTVMEENGYASDRAVSMDAYQLALLISELDPILTQRGKSALYRLTQTSIKNQEGRQTKTLDRLIRDDEHGGLPRVRKMIREKLRTMFEDGNSINFAPGISGPENLNRRMDIFEKYDLPIGNSLSILRYGPLKQRVLGYTPEQASASFNSANPTRPPSNPERAAYTPRQDELANALFEYGRLLDEATENEKRVEDAQERVDSTANRMTSERIAARPPLPGDKYIRLAAQRAFATAAEEAKDYLVVTSSNRPGLRWGRDYTAIYDQKWRKELEKVAGAKAVPVTIRGKVADKELAVIDQAMAALQIKKVEKAAYMEEDGFEARMGGINEWRVDVEYPNIELGLNADKLPRNGVQDGIPTRMSGSIRVLGTRGVENRQDAIKQAKIELRNRLMNEMAVAGWAVPITEQAVEKQRSEGISLFLNEPSQFQKENERIREKDVTLVERVKRKARRELAPGGLLPKAVFDEKITRDNQLASVEFDTVYYVKQLEKAVKSTMGGSLESLPADQQARLNESLAGRLDDSLPQPVKEAIIGMRESIDGLSKQYIKILDRQAGELLATFSGPQRELLDAYMRASEVDNKREANAILDQAKAQFQESAAAEGMSTDLRQPINDIQKAISQLSLLNVIRSNTGKYVNRSYRAFDDANWFENVPDNVLNDARRYLSSRMEESGMDSDRIAERVEVVLNDILKEGTAYGSMESFIKESKLGAKDLSILQKRKDIAPEIRALLGEYQDPRVNYAKTTTKMARLIHNTRFLDKVKEIGMGNFLFTEDNRPPNTTRIAVEGNKSLEPLNGLYAPRDVAQAFSDVGKVRDFIGMPEAIIRLNGGIKFGKTVLAPTTQFRNFMSAAFFAMANGHWDLTKTQKSLSVMREYFTRDGNAGKLAYLRRLKELGVVYDTPFAGEMMRLLEETKLFDGERAEMGAVQGTVKDLATVAQRMYQFGDDFWKIVGYENEKANLLGTGMSEAEAEVEAANRIRNTYPTYSLVGNFVNALRRFPLAGTFVSFPAEIIRTQYNMMKIAAQDMQTPGRRALGVKRLTGMSMAAAMPYAIQSITKEMFDVSDDEEEAIRLMSPYWMENSNFLFMGRNDKGQLEYLDVSFMDPYNYFKRPINAVLRDQPWEEEFISAAKDMVRPFFGSDILATALFEVAKNEKATGGAIYNDSDTAAQQAADMAAHVSKAVEPGIIGNARRIYKAVEAPVTPYGKVYTLEDEAAAFFGFRTTTFDPKTALRFRSIDIKERRNEASAQLKAVLRDPNLAGEEGIREAVERSLAMRQRTFDEALRLISASRSAGLSDLQIMETLKAANFGKLDMGYLMQGQVPPMMLSAASVRNEYLGALRVLGPEKAQQILERYGIASNILSEQFEQ